MHKSESLRENQMHKIEIRARRLNLVLINKKILSCQQTTEGKEGEKFGEYLSQKTEKVGGDTICSWALETVSKNLEKMTGVTRN